MRKDEFMMGSRCKLQGARNLIHEAIEDFEHLQISAPSPFEQREWKNFHNFIAISSLSLDAALEHVETIRMEDIMASNSAG